MATPNQLPAKSPILDKYRSRLQITYRTNISGTPVPQKLPFRVLVLGELQGSEQRAAGPSLRARKIRSIQMGAADSGVPAFMKEMTPWIRVPKSQRSKLEASVPGHLTLTALSFSNPAAGDFDATTKEATVQVNGTATFTSTSKNDNGVCDITFRALDVTGALTLTKPSSPTLKEGQVSLTLNGAVQADIIDKGTGKPTGVLTAMFATGDDPGFSFNVDSKALTIKLSDDATTWTCTVADGTTIPVAAVRTLPFRSLDAFSPDEVAASIPEIHRLRVLRDLVLELQSAVKNNRDLAKAIRASLLPDNKQKLVDFQTWAKASFPQLLLKKA